MRQNDQEKEFNNDLNLIARSSMIVFVGVFLSKLFSYVYGIIIARNFGPEGYGLLTLSLMVIGWFITFSGLGLNRGIVRFIPIFKAQKREDKIKQTFRSSLSKVIVSSTISFLLLFFLSNFIAIQIFNEPQLVIFLKFFSILIPITVALEIFLSVIQANEEIFIYNFIYKFFIGISKIMLLILFIVFGWGLSSIYLSSFIATSLTFVLTVVIFSRLYPNLLNKFKGDSKATNKLFKELVSYSWPLVFYGVIWNVFYWTDTVLIGYFGNTADVGLYSVAEQMAFLLNLAPQLFLQLFFPLINRRYFQGKKEIVKQLAQQIGKWILAINLFVFAVMFLFPDKIIEILFGSSFLRAVNPLKILGVGAIFYSLFKVSDNLLAMKGKSKIILMDIIFIFVLNLIGNFILIPPYGITGASVSTAFSLILLSLIIAFQANKYLSIIPLRRKMVNLIFAIVVSAILFKFIYGLFSFNILFFIVMLVLFLISYLLLSLIFKAFDRNDFSILGNFYQIIKKIRQKNL